MSRSRETSYKQSLLGLQQQSPLTQDVNMLDKNFVPFEKKLVKRPKINQVSRPLLNSKVKVDMQNLFKTRKFRLWSRSTTFLDEKKKFR